VINFAVFFTEHKQLQTFVDNPDVMSEIPAVTSERSISVTIETGCTVALQLANEHRQCFIRVFVALLGFTITMVKTIVFAIIILFKKVASISTKLHR